MNDMTRQRLWLVVVLILGIVAASQFGTNRNLRAELNRTQAELTASKSRTPPAAFTPMSGPTTRRMRAPSATVAPPGPNPVEVFT